MTRWKYVAIGVASLACLAAYAFYAAWNQGEIEQRPQDAVKGTHDVMPAGTALATPAAERWRVPVGERDPVRGAPEAPVTVVQFGAFTSPACKDLAPVAQRLLGEHEGRLRWVWKDTLLAGDGALNRELALVARAAEHKLGVPGFWNVHDRIFDTILDRSSGQSMAKELDITQEQLEKNVEFVNEAHELALGFGVSSIPTLVVNGRAWVGPFDLSRLSQLIQEELEQYRVWTHEDTSGASGYELVLQKATREPQPIVKVERRRRDKNAELQEHLRKQAEQ